MSDTTDRPPSSSAQAEAIGRGLRYLRNRSGLTQGEAAEAAGVTRTAWQNYENGRQAILKMDLQERVSRAVGATRDDLMSAALRPQGAEGFREESAPFQGFGARRHAVFALPEGDVTLSFPAELSDASFEALRGYIMTFLEVFKRPS